MNALTAPAAGGLYDPAYEHDACGVGMVADLHGRQSHRIVEQGLTVLERLDHRGASGAEVATGDGSGILIQVPHRLLVDVAGFGLPDPGDYATGLAFLPQDTDDAAKARTQVEAIAHEEGLAVLGWRELPVEATTIGATAKRAQPRIEQLFVARAAGGRAVGGERARPAARPTTAWPSSGWRSSSASGSSTRSTASTSRPCRRARSSTRGC